MAQSRRLSPVEEREIKKQLSELVGILGGHFNPEARDLAEQLQALRSVIQYTVLDLEATKREKAQLKKALDAK